MDNELKEVLGQILTKVGGLEVGQQRLEASVGKLEVSVQNLDTRLQKVETSVDNLDTRLQKVETSVDKLEVSVQNLDTRLQKVEIKIENTIEPNIKLIYENGIELIKSSRQIEGFKNNLENVNTDVFALKVAVKQLQIAK